MQNSNNENDNIKYFLPEYCERNDDNKACYNANNTRAIEYMDGNLLAERGGTIKRQLIHVIYIFVGLHALTAKQKKNVAQTLEEFIFSAFSADIQFVLDHLAGCTAY